MSAVCVYQWVRVPAFEGGDVATGKLNQDVSATKAFIS